MKPLQIIYMGTPAFAISPLQKILDSEHQVIAVVTAPDKKSGRGKQLTASPIKVFCIENNLPILQPPNLKDESFVSELKEHNADVFVVVAFRMLPKEVWSIPSKGSFNLHASLLPKYRGAAPIHWAIINGEEETGVTTFFINEQIDTGEIIAQKQTTILPDENTGNLSNRLESLGADLVIETLQSIAAGKVNTIPQPKTEEHLAPKLKRENTRLQWNEDGKVIERFVRGLQPYPCAWTSLHNSGTSTYCKIYQVEFFEAKQMLQPGCVFIDNRKLMVSVQNGSIHVKRLQLQNKKPMSDFELLNGYEMNDQAYFENP
ncbi:MAG: methionyl-tRNA formyltransferase [Bacteroidota bacterium]|nr:methionyl-tRNA formyltransferase [Bacteroidota bacterium]MEC8238922.1 methionyl-tRNA formyltransferase [Bacteroidota bacterium]